MKWESKEIKGKEKGNEGNKTDRSKGNEKEKKKKRNS